MCKFVEPPFKYLFVGNPVYIPKSLLFLYPFAAHHMTLPFTLELQTRASPWQHPAFHWKCCFSPQLPSFPVCLHYPVPTFEMLTTVCIPPVMLFWVAACTTAPVKSPSRQAGAAWLLIFQVALTVILSLTPVPSPHILQLFYFTCF